MDQLIIINNVNHMILDCKIYETDIRMHTEKIAI